MKYLLITAFALILLACKKDKTEDPTPSGPSLENTYGYGVLAKLNGIWSGPVTSTTALGSFPKWIVDFRPISNNQVSAKNELDSLNGIFMSFFIVKHNNAYKVAFRNGGGFAGSQRVSYLLADSVSETTTHSFYRFSEVVQGKSRAYSEVIFSTDSLYIHSYTNGSLHMSWSSKLINTTAANSAISAFNFPQKSMTKDFSTAFDAVSESIYYSPNSTPPSDDPYTINQQPYLGVTNASFTFAAGFTPVSTKKVMIICTTEPLFSGFTFNSAALNSISRYVFVSSQTTNFSFNYMHPGTYYYYAMYDENGNQTIDSGDWISATNATFNLSNLGTASATTQINFTIP